MTSGADGMGAVYRAKHVKLGREVANEILPSALASDTGRLRRLEREARCASALNHPNIVTIDSRQQTFVLQKSNGSWVITDIQ